MLTAILFFLCIGSAFRSIFGISDSLVDTHVADMKKINGAVVSAALR